MMPGRKKTDKIPDLVKRYRELKILSTGQDIHTSEFYEKIQTLTTHDRLETVKRPLGKEKQKKRSDNADMKELEICWQCPELRGRDQISQKSQRRTVELERGRVCDSICPKPCNKINEHVELINLCDQLEIPSPRDDIVILLEPDIPLEKSTKCTQLPPSTKPEATNIIIYQQPDAKIVIYNPPETKRNGSKEISSTEEQDDEKPSRDVQQKGEVSIPKGISREQVLREPSIKASVTRQASIKEAIRQPSVKELIKQPSFRSQLERQKSAQEEIKRQQSVQEQMMRQQNIREQEALKKRVEEIEAQLINQNLEGWQRNASRSRISNRESGLSFRSQTLPHTEANSLISPSVLSNIPEVEERGSLRSILEPSESLFPKSEAQVLTIENSESWERKSQGPEINRSVQLVTEPSIRQVSFYNEQVGRNDYQNPEFSKLNGNLVKLSTHNLKPSSSYRHGSNLSGLRPQADEDYSMSPQESAAYSRKSFGHEVNERTGVFSTIYEEPEIEISSYKEPETGNGCNGQIPDLMESTVWKQQPSFVNQIIQEPNINEPFLERKDIPLQQSSRLRNYESVSRSIGGDSRMSSVKFSKPQILHPPESEILEQIPLTSRSSHLPTESEIRQSSVRSIRQQISRPNYLQSGSQIRQPSARMLDTLQYPSNYSQSQSQIRQQTIEPYASGSNYLQLGSQSRQQSVRTVDEDPYISVSKYVQSGSQTRPQSGSQIRQQLGSQIRQQSVRTLDEDPYISGSNYLHSGSQIRQQSVRTLDEDPYISGSKYLQSGSQIRQQLVRTLDEDPYISGSKYLQSGSQIRQQSVRTLDEDPYISGSKYLQSGSQIRQQSGSQIRQQSGSQIQQQLGSQIRQQLGSQIRQQLGSQIRQQSVRTLDEDPYISGSKYLQSGSQIPQQPGNQIRQQSFRTFEEDPYISGSKHLQSGSQIHQQSLRTLDEDPYISGSKYLQSGSQIRRQQSVRTAKHKPYSDGPDYMQAGSQIREQSARIFEEVPYTSGSNYLQSGSQIRQHTTRTPQETYPIDSNYMQPEIQIQRQSVKTLQQIPNLQTRSQMQPQSAGTLQNIPLISSNYLQTQSLIQPQSVRELKNVPHISESNYLHPLSQIQQQTTRIPENVPQTFAQARGDIREHSSRTFLEVPEEYQQDIISQQENGIFIVPPDMSEKVSLGTSGIPPRSINRVEGMPQEPRSNYSYLGSETQIQPKSAWMVGNVPNVPESNSSGTVTEFQPQCNAGPTPMDLLPNASFCVVPSAYDVSQQTQSQTIPNTAEFVCSHCQNTNYKYGCCQSRLGKQYHKSTTERRRNKSWSCSK